MSDFKLCDYKRNRVDKLDGVTTGINVERRHKIFVETNGVNLSALVRDLLDKMMSDEVAERLKDKT